MKKRSIILLGLITILLNSCVYSLFPIYTEDTLVFKKELLGKWDLGDDSYMIFEAGNGEEKEVENKSEETHKYELFIREDLSISSDEPIFVTVDGKKIYNEDTIRKVILEGIEEQENEQEAEPSIIAELTQKIANSKPKIKDYKGTIATYEEKSYRLTVVDDKKGTNTIYAAHLVDIGGDIFMDLYPITEYDSENFFDNYFPVHTFYKVEVSKDTFTMIHFDLDKLNDLFESNLIRLRHENVDGTILITAQPKELQKFFDKYADDESVFDSIETYPRVAL